MLPGVVANGLRGTPGISSIEPVMTNREYTAIMDGRLESLQEIDTAAGQKASLRLKLTLRRQDGTILWSTTLVGDATTRAGTVGAVVDRMNAALKTALGQGRTELAASLAESAAPAP